MSYQHLLSDYLVCSLQTLTLFFHRRIMFEYDNVRCVPYTWNYVAICHCKVRLVSWLFIMTHAYQRLTSATEVNATCHLSLPCRLQWSGAVGGGGFLCFSCVPSSSDIRTKRSLAILVVIPVIIFFPSVTREVLIQPFASDIQLYFTGKKDVCVEALVYVNFSKCTLTEPKYLLRGIFSQFLQLLYQLFLFNSRQMLVFLHIFLTLRAMQWCVVTHCRLCGYTLQTV